MYDKERFTLEEAHLKFAKSLNGEIWALLDKKDRSRDDNERMLAAAFASFYHWLHVGKEIHRQRGEYMIARAYLALENRPEALAHARRCLELTGEFEEQMQDFDFAFAYEMWARANAAVGNLEIARQYYQKARQAGEAIHDDEDKSIFFGDFNGGEWFHLF